MKDSRNKTTLFLLPLLGLSKEQTVDNRDFLNAYIEHDTIVIVYKSGYLTVHYTPMTKEIKMEIDNFKQGHYNQFSNKNKQTILDFWNLKKDSRLYYILNPSKFMKAEFGVNVQRSIRIWDKPDMSEELLNLKS